MTAPTTQRDYKLGPVLPHVKRLANHVGAKFGLTTILGWRASARDMAGHPAGRALDFMCTKAQGDQIAAYLIANAQDFAVSYVIWEQQIAEQPKFEWQPMEDRGSPTQNHFDHVHAQLKLLGTDWRDDTSRPDGVPTVPENVATVGGAVVDAALPDWMPEVGDLAIKVLAGATAIALVVIGATRTVSPGGQ